jgi:hypothetical protein
LAFVNVYITWLPVPQGLPEQELEPLLELEQGPRPGPEQALPWEPVSAPLPSCILRLRKIMPRRKTVKK